MRLSRTIAYAIHATIDLARAEPGVPIPCSQLARDGKLPERFLLQILRGLVKKGILQSTRGVDGGYCLARPPADISLYEIVTAFDNPLEPIAETLTDLAPQARKKILNVLHSAAAGARSELEKLSLADMLTTGRENGPSYGRRRLPIATIASDVVSTPEPP